MSLRVQATAGELFIIQVQVFNLIVVCSYWGHSVFVFVIVGKKLLIFIRLMCYSLMWPLFSLLNTN